jgi:hypothetical protein
MILAHAAVCLEMFIEQPQCNRQQRVGDPH